MKENYLIGIGFKLLNCLIFPIMSLLMLKCVSLVPVMQVFFIQVLLGAILSFAYLKVINHSVPLYLPKKDLLLYVARAVVNLVAFKLWLFSLTKMGINEATALGYTGPLWVSLMAIYIIGERFRIWILLLIFINIIGMLIIIQPKYAEIPWEGLVSVLSSILLWSVYEVICKKQTTNQHYMLQTFYFMSISAIILLPFVLTSWQSLSLEQGGMLVILALLAVTNITVIFISFSFAPLTFVAPFSYARLIFTVLITAFIHHVTPNVNVFIGAAIIMLANGYFTYKVSITKNKN